MSKDWIVPAWPAPAWVRARMTTRHGGCSTGAYASMNVGDHVGDDPARVAQNRAGLIEGGGVEPLWLEQVHGTRVIVQGQGEQGGGARGEGDRCADACVVRSPGQAPVVMCADCLPVLLCDRQGSVVAAVHAGWRGLAAGVIEATVRAMALPPAELMAWLGPAIGPQHFEVGDEVRRAFVAQHPQSAQAFCAAMRSGHWLANLHALAELRLRAAGVFAVFGLPSCTFSEPARFFSYRRDGVCGRMAALIWIER